MTVAEGLRPARPFDLGRGVVLWVGAAGGMHVHHIIRDRPAVQLFVCPVFYPQAEAYGVELVDEEGERYAHSYQVWPR